MSLNRMPMFFVCSVLRQVERHHIGDHVISYSDSGLVYSLINIQMILRI